MKAAIIISTYPTRDSASRAARKMVKSGAAACVNISRIYSVYAWRGKIEDAPEYIALFKTTAKNRPSLKRKIRDSHPYDVPEIVEIDVSSVNEPYLRWLAESTG